MDGMTSQPWQVQWKRPCVDFVKTNDKVINTKTSSPVEKYPCSCSSVKLNATERNECLSHVIQKRGKDASKAALSSSLYILNATVSSERENEVAGGHINLSLSEAIHTDDDDDDGDNPLSSDHHIPISKIYSKSLRWPGSLLGSSTDSDSDAVGVISIAFCRVSESCLEQMKEPEPFQELWKKKKNDDSPNPFSFLPGFGGGKKETKEESKERELTKYEKQEKVSDALDAIRLLSLFGGGTESNFEGIRGITDANIDAEEKKPLPDAKEPNEQKKDSSILDGEPIKYKLVLCCLTNDNCLYFFSALDLLLWSHHQKSLSDDLGGLSSVLFGDVLLNSLEESIVPLSRPLKKMTLSVCRSTKQQIRQINEVFNNGGKNIPQNPLQFFNFDFIFLDATIEPSLKRYFTMANQVTCCVTAFQNIAIGGKGIKIRSNIQKKRPSENAGVEVHKEEIPNNNVFDNDRTESVEQENYTLSAEGGFITFVSLSHCNETKTLFLPFAPAKLSAVKWNGMNFIICIRDTFSLQNFVDDGPKDKYYNDNLTHLDRANVIAIRVDSYLDGNVEYEVVSAASMLNGNGIYSYDEPENPSSDNIVFNTPTVSKSPKKKSTMSLQKIRRFQPIPIVGNFMQKFKRLNQSLIVKELVDSTTDNQPALLRSSSSVPLCSSTPIVKIMDISMNANSSPPALIVVYQVTLGRKSVRVVTCTMLRSFQYIHHEHSLQYQYKLWLGQKLDSTSTNTMQPKATATLQNEGGGINRNSNNKDEESFEFVIDTQTESRHFAYIKEIPRKTTLVQIGWDQEYTKTTTSSPKYSSWCIGGQGWSIVGGEPLMDAYFICWDGATNSHGADIQSLQVLQKKGNSKDAVRCMPLRASHVFTFDDSLSNESCDILSPNKGISEKDVKQKFFQKDDRKLPFNSSMSTIDYNESFRRLSSYRSIENDDAVDSTITQNLDDAVIHESRYQEFPEKERKRSFSSDEYTSILNANDSNATRGGGAVNNMFNHTIEENVENSILKSSTPLVANKRNKNEIFTVVLNGLSKGSHSSSINEGSTEDNVNDKRQNASNSESLQKFEKLTTSCRHWNEFQSETIETKANKIVDQALVLTLHGVSGDMFVFSIRKKAVGINFSDFVENNSIHTYKGTPFDEVIPWLNQQKSYYHAALVALKLIGDDEALEDLQNSKASGTLLGEGVLDGVSKHQSLSSTSNTTSKEQRNLADIAVGCLAGGGPKTSLALHGFLKRNKQYDETNTCILLTAISMQNRDLDVLEQNELWSIHCLLEVSVSRHCMESSLELLNSCLPHELRRMQPEGQDYEDEKYNQYCEELVSQIVNATPESPSQLLNLINVDEMRFWETLDHETKMAYSLIPVNQKYPMLQEKEVRQWALDCINRLIQRIDEESLDVVELPSDWLCQLCVACMENSGSEWKQVLLLEYDEFNLETMKRISESIRNAIKPQDQLGMDFTLLIATLLLLHHRSVQWSLSMDDDVTVTTQDLLNEVCWLAGRRGIQDSRLFPLDPKTTMVNFVRTRNVIGGANFIGGPDGLVLSACHVLIEKLGVNVDKAEDMLTDSNNDLISLLTSVSSEKGKVYNKHKEGIDRPFNFLLRPGHYVLLRQLQEHVLSVEKYGDLEIKIGRGCVDPIFAGQIFFRAWFFIVSDEVDPAAAWLVEWLRIQLNLNSSKPKRLACAALARILLWPGNAEHGEINTDTSNSTQIPLSIILRLEEQFLLDLALACCGTLECLPKCVMDDLSASGSLSSQMDDITNYY